MLGGVTLWSTVITPLIKNLTESNVNSLAKSVTQTVQRLAEASGENCTSVAVNKALSTVMSDVIQCNQSGESNYTGSVIDDCTTVNQTVLPTINGAEDISKLIVAMAAGVTMAAGVIAAGAATYRFCQYLQPHPPRDREHEVELLNWVNSPLMHGK